MSTNPKRQLVKVIMTGGEYMEVHWKGKCGLVKVLFILKQNDELVKINFLTLHCTLSIYKAIVSSFLSKLFVTACGSVHSHWLCQLDLHCFSPYPY